MNLREKSMSGRWLGHEELQNYLSVGKNTAAKIGHDAGAVVKVGRRVLFDRFKIDQYMEALTKGE